jgi:hypothetical protein
VAAFSSDMLFPVCWDVNENGGCVLSLLQGLSRRRATLR